MSDVYSKHLPCPCGKSSDAFSLYEDGGFCFSCSKKFSTKGEPLTEDDSSNPSVSYTFQPLPWRGVSEDTMKKYGVVTKIGGDQPKEIGYPYKNGVVKVRSLSTKMFYWRNGKPSSGLFGVSTFPDPKDSVVITEGELDALSVWEMIGVPALSVQSAVTAARDVKEHYDYLNKYTKIILAFDNDEPGRKALAQVATLFDFNKVFVLDMNQHKDPNGYLEAGHINEFRTAYRKIGKYVPDGVISSYDDVYEAFGDELNKPVMKHPIKRLNDLLGGLFLGKVYLFSGLEGIGKTEVLRKYQHSVLKSTDYNIGIIHLEEKRRDTLTNLVTYELKMPLKQPDIAVSREEKLEAYKRLTKRDNRVFVYNHFGSDDPDALLDIIRYLVAVCECKFIFFDHINHFVSSMSPDKDETKLLDYLSARLEFMVEELDFSLLHICHINDQGNTRGSRNISKAAHVHIRLERDIETADEAERLRTHIIVKKNRPTSSSGPSGYVFYDPNTGCLRDMEEEAEVLGYPRPTL